MASVSPILALGAASMVVVSAVVSGCATTQDANKRAEISAGRILASREPLVVKGTDPKVRVVRTAVVNSKKGSVIVVVLHNTGDQPVNDLPIEVGPDGGDPINTRRNVPYFQSHAPAIAPGAEVTWVYVSKEPIGSNRAFARIGGPESPSLATAGHVSELQVGKSSDSDGTSVRSEITNDTGIPQYALDVYAVARKNGRYVAAGRVSIDHLGVSQSTHVTLPLIGDAKGAQVQVFAPQTLFE